jgi:alkylhydroperoxidase/carboxymuconolactone decarboxylase family protein YurZ/ADP-ribose pyrophosphatase YjhB (NUDIX family)
MAERPRPEPSGHRDAVFGLAERDGAVLLVENDRVTAGGPTAWWDLPGGAARPGERLPEALEREWREETGLSAKVGDLLFVVDGAKRRAPSAPPLYTWRAFVFAVGTSGAPRAGPGIRAAAWVPRAEVLARLVAPYHAPLRAWLGGTRRPHATVDWVEAAPAIPTAGAARLRPLLVLGAGAAAGSADLVLDGVRQALAEGLPRAWIEETLLQVVPYAGFPRALAAFAAARPLLGPPPEAAERAGRGAAGPEAFERVYGETAARVREGLGALHPLLPAWTLEEAYGRVLSRPALPLPERELLAVAMLTAMGGLDDPLLGHMRAALRLGASMEDVAAAVEVVPASLGEGSKERARRLLARAG